MEHIKILIVMTSHALMGDSGEPTGVWLEEFATPYYAFVDAEYAVHVASIEGGAVPVDPRSRRAAGENEPSVDRLLADSAALRGMNSTVELSTVNIEDYDALFLPGGHGTMWDLPQSRPLANAVSSVLARDGVVAAVCHGPAGLVSANDATGRPVVAGRRVATFTNAEEEAAGLTEVVPFLLETRLADLGATIVSGPDFKHFAVRDGTLITGQNPASSRRVADLVIEALAEAEQHLALQAN